MRNRQDVIDFALTFPGSYLDAPFYDQNWQLIRFKDNKKAFLWLYEREGFVNITVKLEPISAQLWRGMYESVQPAYHLNKEHWSMIILDGSVPDDDIKLMINESYILVTDSPSKRIYDAVRKIPYGKVATYSQIAALAGNPKMSRAVGNALHKNPDPSGVPCYRVVNSAGKLSGRFAFGGAEAQQKLLEAEGIEVVNSSVDLDLYGWKDTD